MATRPPPQTLFRVRPFMKALALFAALMMAGAAAYFRMKQGLSPMTLLCGVMSAVASLGFAQTLLAYIHLQDDALVISSGLKKRRHERATLDSVTWEAGSGVSIKKVDGTWIQLPEMGYNSQSLSNSIRAWLRRTA